MTEQLRWGFVAACASTLTLMAALLTTVQPLERPKYGHRGMERQRAIDAAGLFARCEPTIRFIAALFALLPFGKIREKCNQELERTDDVLGLSADELFALSAISCVGVGSIVSVTVHCAQASRWISLAAFVLGALLPRIQVVELIRRRAKLVARALPPAIEIASMCMSAGLDFPGSLRMLSERDSCEPTPLAREFAVILEQLDFGHTRREALERFRQRVPSRAVVDFVNAVIQAEQKGNPLARVLQVQGRMLNMRRSVAAEEAAARAGVLMIIPMVFLVAAILLLLMGPFMVKGIGW